MFVSTSTRFPDSMDTIFMGFCTLPERSLHPRVLQNSAHSAFIAWLLNDTLRISGNAAESAMIAANTGKHASIVSPASLYFRNRWMTFGKSSVFAAASNAASSEISAQL